MRSVAGDCSSPLHRPCPQKRPWRAGRRCRCCNRLLRASLSLLSSAHEQSESYSIGTSPESAARSYPGAPRPPGATFSRVPSPVITPEPGYARTGLRPTARGLCIVRWCPRPEISKSKHFSLERYPANCCESSNPGSAWRHSAALPSEWAYQEVVFGLNPATAHIWVRRRCSRLIRRPSERSNVSTL